MLLGAVSPSTARGNDYNQKTILTFSHPFEIPGHVFPAGTYTLQLLDSMSDRHIVQFSITTGRATSASLWQSRTIGSRRRTRPSSHSTKCRSVPRKRSARGSTPARSAGQEFVYPKRRALELAVTQKVVVPAIAVDISDPDLKTVPIVAITPDRKEVPVAAVIQTTPPAGQTVASASTPQGRQLPQTGSPLSLVTLLGIACFGVAAALLFGCRRPVPRSVP